MKLPRRQFLHLAAGAAALPAVSRFAFAQAWPTKIIRAIVPFTAGSAVDIIPRTVFDRLLALTAIPIPGTAAEFHAEMAATTEKWAKVIRTYNINAE